ncbi:hypothetical protein NEOLI_001946 [Neolecta irregularis DAH-3]|uniref:Uncharacterized protein n=1 Tax=Neolecta irregularis (strain DAH-3) TaxID=1198029 RepID=A0A1U7LWU5_NEOID|nr:hypothetical protein NEOLI_001946 [Neolecta irregularis DAH-3]|eukprot:OLL27150.1 hypothetical protein NEOLI_001946 [Neolecta irregularis DAH-3]
MNTAKAPNPVRRQLFNRNMFGTKESVPRFQGAVTDIVADLDRLSDLEDPPMPEIPDEEVKKELDDAREAQAIKNIYTGLRYDQDSSITLYTSLKKKVKELETSEKWMFESGV